MSFNRSLSVPPYGGASADASFVSCLHLVKLTYNKKSPSRTHAQVCAHVRTRSARARSRAHALRAHPELNFVKLSIILMLIPEKVRNLRATILSHN